MKAKLALFLMAFVVLIPGIANAEVIPEPPTMDDYQPEAPSNSHCPELYQVTIDNWPGAQDNWRTLDRIFYRESRCRAGVVNRYGCVGLMQICRINHRRMGESRQSLKDPATNIATGYKLCRESMRQRRSCWRPWR